MIQMTLTRGARAELDLFRAHLVRHQAQAITDCKFCVERVRRARDKAWSDYAQAIDDAEYRRTIEHRALGGEEADRRWNERTSNAATQREQTLASLARIADV